MRIYITWHCGRTIVIMCSRFAFTLFFWRANVKRTALKGMNRRRCCGNCEDEPTRQAINREVPLRLRSIWFLWGGRGNPAVHSSKMKSQRHSPYFNASQQARYSKLRVAMYECTYRQHEGSAGKMEPSRKIDSNSLPRVPKLRFKNLVKNCRRFPLFILFPYNAAELTFFIPFFSCPSCRFSFSFGPSEHISMKTPALPPVP